MHAGSDLRIRGAQRIDLLDTVGGHAKRDDMSRRRELEPHRPCGRRDDTWTVVCAKAEPRLWCEHDMRNRMPRTTSCSEQQREHGEWRLLDRDLASAGSLSYTSTDDPL